MLRSPEDEEEDEEEPDEGIEMEGQEKGGEKDGVGPTGDATEDTVCIFFSVIPLKNVCFSLCTSLFFLLISHTL